VPLAADLESALREFVASGPAELRDRPALRAVSHAVVETAGQSGKTIAAFMIGKSQPDAAGAGDYRQFRAAPGIGSGMLWAEQSPGAGVASIGFWMFFR